MKNSKGVPKMNKSTVATKQVVTELHIVARAEFKKSGYVLYGVQSGENLYQVTCNLKHQVTGCSQKSGEPCKGWKFTGHCKHATLVQSREYEREAQEREAYCVDFQIYA
jgi:hypothetical protein